MAADPGSGVENARVPRRSDAASGGVAAGLADFVAMTKPRLNALTIFAVGAGWKAAGGPWISLRLLVVLAGAAFVASGSSVLNQWFERDRDARMNRTSDRPLPAGRVPAVDALALGSILSVAGLFTLYQAANQLTAGLAAICLVTYVFLYTPLKTRTTLNTLVGTIPGALPPVMGVAAAVDALPREAWFLFALLVAWQLPHFLSIAWIYREDYRRGGFAMLPVVEGGEDATARQAVIHALLVLVVTMTASPIGLAGRTYTLVALVAGVGFAWTAVRFAQRRTDASARLLLRASLVHLPIVLLAFAWDRA
ncbi:MAG: heme o synthase [Planctomycetes bacterium]|nr:heme o synthase [Planctomycetota bacterium]